MKRFLLVPVLGLTALAVSATAQAQSGGWLDSSRPAYSANERQSYSDSRRAAYDNGYREGLRTGEQDGRRGSTFTYQNERTYRRADKGYHRTFGDIDRYRQSFRSGYASGYSDGYRRFGRNTRGPGRQEPRYGNGYPDGGYPNGGYRNGTYRGGYNNSAFQNGVNDGHEKGQEDANKRRSFDVLRHKWYREGDRHYDGQYGSREQYKDVYRQGFKEGYDRGFREGRYR
jgi:hypothetical protein